MVDDSEVILESDFGPGMNFSEFWWRTLAASRMARGGGFLIHSGLFAQTNFRLFCLRYKGLSCEQTFHLQPIVQQVSSKTSFLVVWTAAIS